MLSQPSMAFVLYFVLDVLNKEPFVGGMYANT